MKSDRSLNIGIICFVQHVSRSVENGLKKHIGTLKTQINPHLSKAHIDWNFNSVQLINNAIK